MQSRLVDLDRIASELGGKLADAIIRAVVAETERDAAVRERDELRQMVEDDPRRTVTVVPEVPAENGQTDAAPIGLAQVCSPAFIEAFNVKAPGSSGE